MSLRSFSANNADICNRFMKKNKQLKNIFESGELQKDSVISILETTAEDGKIYHKTS